MELKKQNTYCDRELFVDLPFPSWVEKFDLKEKVCWWDILKGCTDSVTIYESYSVNAYQCRNYYMVDKLQYGIAIYENDKTIRSGIGMNVNYAMKKKLSIIFIHPYSFTPTRPLLQNSGRIAFIEAIFFKNKVATNAHSLFADSHKMGTIVQGLPD